MRHALDKIIQLYKTSPVFQDLVETAAGTGIAATGQALFTDMTPEQIALASAAGFGAGMVGRPIVGRAGQAVGGYFDRRNPQASQTFLKSMHEGMEMYPQAMQEVFQAKMGPYQKLGGFAQYGNMLGRAYGDNLAQAAVALAAPGIFGDKEEEK